MMPEESFIFEKERTFKEIYTDAIQFIQQYGQMYITLVVLYAGPLFVLSAYFSSHASIEINETQELFSSPYLWYSLLVDFFADVVVNGVTFASIIMFAKTGTIQRENVMTFFNQHFLYILGITFVANVIISLGFMLLIIPGIICLVPMSLFVYDRLISKESFEISFIRSFELTRSNLSLSYGVVFFMYAAMFVVKYVAESFMDVTSNNYIIVNTVLQSVIQIIFTCSSIIIVLLYYSLLSKFKNRTL